MIFCKICNNKKKLTNTRTVIKSNLPVFDHISFNKISNFCTYTQCNYCQIISVQQNKEIKKNIKYFTSKIYSNSKQTSQKKNINKKKKYLYRSQHQANYISKNIKKNKVNILDIGCFDGKLLGYLSLICKKSFFYGHDINLFLKKSFPNKKNFFFIKEINDIKCKFDCIIFSHSIMYIKNLAQTLLTCKKLLKRDGKIFIQIPDIKKNIFYSLMGDQYYNFTENSLINIFKLFGFKIKKIDKKHFPREIVLVLKKDININNKNTKLIKKDSIFQKNLISLNKLKHKLEKKFNKNQYLVLGTTVNAAFVDEIISKNINHFVDENLTLDKNYFREKKIYHPRKIYNYQNVILPFINKGNRILSRFKKMYKGNYIKI